MSARSSYQFLITLMLSASVIHEKPAHGATIAWRADLNAAITEARNRHVPLYLYIPANRDFRRGAENWVDADEIVQRDALVVEFLKTRFVPVRLQRATTNKPVFEKLGIQMRDAMQAVTATADLVPLEKIGAAGLGKKPQLLGMLAKSFRRHRNGLYDREIQPVLSAAAPSAENVERALDLVQHFVILKADKDIIALLNRALTNDLRVKVYQTLSVLSTPESARALLSRADGDADAAEALGRCTPGVVELIAEGMSDRYDAKHLVSYEAACRILNIRNPKPRRFWNGPDARGKAETVARLKRQAAHVAADWKKRVQPYR